MKCQFYERWLMASADNELTGWRASLLRSHLAVCDRCTSELAQLRKLRQLIGDQKPDYLSRQQDPIFWQRLRARLQAEPQPAHHGGLVLAYSERAKSKSQPPKPSDKSGGIAFFGLFPTHRLAWVAVAAAVLIGGLLAFRLGHRPPNDQVVFDIPLLPAPGDSQVNFTEVKSMKDTWAGVVRFDKPDVDINVIWVDDLPALENSAEPKGPGG